MLLPPHPMPLSTSRNPAHKISPCSVLSAGQNLGSCMVIGSLSVTCAQGQFTSSLLRCQPAAACRQTRFHHSPWGVKWEVEQRVSSGGEQNGACESLIIVNATSGWL
jgi:hypothetical protein